jgi:hypothetical protein
MMRLKIHAVVAIALLVPAFAAGCGSTSPVSETAALPRDPTLPAAPLTVEETEAQLTRQLDKYDVLSDGSPEFDRYTFALAERQTAERKLAAIVADLVRNEELVWAKRVLAVTGFGAAPRSYSDLGDLVKVIPQMMPGASKVPTAAKLIGQARLVAYADLLNTATRSDGAGQPLAAIAAVEKVTLTSAQFAGLPQAADAAGLDQFLNESLAQDCLTSGTNGLLYFAYITENPDKTAVRAAVRQALSGVDPRARANGELTEARFVYLYNLALGRTSGMTRAFGPALGSVSMTAAKPQQYDFETPSQIYQIRFADPR